MPGRRDVARGLTGAMLVVAAILLCWGLAHADGPTDSDAGRSTMGGDKPLPGEMDAATQGRIDRGLAWLAKNADQGANQGPRAESIAVQSLAGIAFMANGDTPQQGRYAGQVKRILDDVLRNSQESGLLARPTDNSPMYGHGFAMLFLAEVYGMTGDNSVKERLQRAIRLTVGTQNPEGGWQYQPLPQTADTSATICQVMALRAARNAGIAIPKHTVDDAIKYTLRCQNADGGFRYMLNAGLPRSGWARSSASTVALKYLDAATPKEYASAKKYLMNFLPGPAQADDGDPGAVAGMMYFYGNYYMCQAMFMLGGDAWAAYWPLIRADLSKKQKDDGSWSGEVNTIYSTSLALIILQMPNRLLPILQK